MRIPDHIVNQIYDRADILEIVGEYVRLKKRGKYYVGLSPFKNERTPSFTVTPDKGIYKCFSTGKGGNAVGFLMEMEGYAYPEALRALAERYHIEIPEEDGPDATSARETADKIESLRILNNFAADFFEKQLYETEEGRQFGLAYFENRGFESEVRQLFRLGYSPESWTALADAARKHKFSEELLLESGLVVRSEKNGQLYDRFRGRLMFAIHDAGGKIAGFSGRVRDKTQKGAKYVNSPESPLYHKSKLLYGLYFAKQAIRDSGVCYLTEGYADVLSLYQAGVKNVVASSGTALTEEQTQLLKRFAKKVVLLYDGDEAGVKAALKGGDLLLSRGLNVRALALPEGEDPDSYVQANGGPAFRDYVNKRALDFPAYKYEMLRRDTDASDPAQRAEIVNAVAASLARIEDDVQRGLFIQHSAERMKISEQMMISAVNKALRLEEAEAEKEARREQRRAESATAPPPPPIPEVRPESPPQFGPGPGFDYDARGCEKEILRLLLNYGEQNVTLRDEETDEEFLAPVFDYVIEEIGDGPFQLAAHETIRKELYSAWEADRSVPLYKLTAECGPEVAALAAELTTSRYALSENWRSKDIYVPDLDHDLALSLNEALAHYKIKQVNKMLYNNDLEIKRWEEAAQDDFALLDRLLKRKMKLLHLRREISDEIGGIVVFGR